MKIVLSVVVGFSLVVALNACGSRKIVARNCEKAGNAEVFVCDSL